LLIFDELVSPKNKIVAKSRNLFFLSPKIFLKRDNPRRSRQSKNAPQGNLVKAPGFCGFNGILEVFSRPKHRNQAYK